MNRERITHLYQVISIIQPFFEKCNEILAGVFNNAIKILKVRKWTFRGA
jgi:hypothetical protein